MKINLRIFSFHLLFCFLILERESVYGFPGDEVWGLEGSGESHWAKAMMVHWLLRMLLLLVLIWSVAEWEAERRRFRGQYGMGNAADEQDILAGVHRTNKHIVFLLYELWTMKFTVRGFCNSIKKFIYVKVNNNSYISSQITKNSVFLCDQIVSFLCSCRRIVFVWKLG